MISASQNKCILECGIVHKSFSRCTQFQIKNIQEKFKFVDQFKVCVICLKYEKDCRCVSSAIKNQIRKNCKHCHQNHHYLLCTTDNGLLHSLKIRNRFLGLTKKRRKRKRQKNYFPGQFVNGRHVVTITKPKGEIYTEGLYGYGTALGVKQPGCRGPEFRVASSPIKTEAETLNIVDVDLNQPIPACNSPTTQASPYGPAILSGFICACEDIQCDSFYPACPYGQFSVDVAPSDVDLNQPIPACNSPTKQETSPCGPESRVASCPIKTEAETLNIRDCDPFMRPHQFAATSIEECLPEPSIQTSFDYNLVDIDVKKSDIAIIKPKLLRILLQHNHPYMDKGKNSYPFQEIIKMIDDIKFLPQFLQHYNINFWCWKKHFYLLCKDLIEADMGDPNDMKSHGYSYQPPIQTSPPLAITPSKTIQNFLNHLT